MAPLEVFVTFVEISLFIFLIQIGAPLEGGLSSPPYLAMAD